ncbi:MAG: tRNA pseudouridine synthase A [Planctomycetota bacterium]|jgi:tRNA pseudouridine38-40 synthase|nr:tRNA pseudouridine synthase A [Planctomycetota bacterium]
MPTFALELEFDGAGYAGTALQRDQRTVQGELRRALERIDGPGALTRSSGRLDAGVHAEALVVSCILSKDWEPGALGRAINGNLDHDCRVLRVAAVAEGWDALQAKSRKTYAYRVIERAAAPALERRSWHWRRLVFPQHLQTCAHALVGEHDLSAFAGLRNDGSDSGDPVRKYAAAGWSSAPLPGGGTEWTFCITGLGFLYKQVRGLVGGQIAVAMGQHSLDEFLAAIGAGRSHPKIGQMAPSEGLRLERVAYRSPPAWQALF